MPGGLPDAIRRRLAPLALPADNGWIVAGVVVFVAAALRLHNLHHPPGIMFDEVYYANEARSLLEYGVEYDQGNPKYVVHPPLGEPGDPEVEALQGEEGAEGDDEAR